MAVKVAVLPWQALNTPLMNTAGAIVSDKGAGSLTIVIHCPADDIKLKLGTNTPSAGDATVCTWLGKGNVPPSPRGFSHCVPNQRCTRMFVFEKIARSLFAYRNVKLATGLVPVFDIR